MAEILLSLKNFENKKVDKFFSELVNLSWRCHPDLNWGVELLQSSALPLGYGTEWSKAAPKNGASDEARTRYLHLGKVALYQMSYTRIWCPGPESNQRHADFQSAALPTELSGQIFSAPNGRGPGNFNPKRDPRDGDHPVGDGDPERARTVDL